MTDDQDRQGHIAGLLPALAQLDLTAGELDQHRTTRDNSAQVSTYDHQAAHARHLIFSASATCQEVEEAERLHRGDGEKGFAARGYDHALHPRQYEDAEVEL
ncbi:hypothetical protein [Streptomyces sp. NPDC006925]|uniref:hypothetical protein n=1 Tax=Streptomyces sp. NPDC006925 TaxID=3364768 RepID=UPI003680F9F8